MPPAVELARKGLRVYATMRTPSKRHKLDETAVAAGASASVEVLPLDVTSDEG
jgi:NAD(P)-dependent dehydrogenase (short-subunit alcohol dehydrogenase family)